MNATSDLNEDDEALTGSGMGLENAEDARASEAEIIETIHSAILEQRLPPGTKLSESALCDIFQVGRARIRRVLLVLASREIIQLPSNRGAFVAEPTAEEARNIFEARCTIEPTIIRNVVRHATAADLKLLDAKVNSEFDADSRKNRRNAIRHSGEFHVTLAEIGRNQVLEGIIKQLVARTSLIIGMFGTPGGINCSNDEHRQLVEMIRKRDADKAAKLMLHHLHHIDRELNLTRPLIKKTNLKEIFASLG